MYVPRRYEEKDREKIFAFIHANSFAIMVSVKDGLPLATHIPLALEKNEQGGDILTGHLSKGNDQKATLFDGARLLCIFPGPHAYISPRWYTSLNVPTWNYIAVHAYGTVKIQEGPALRAALSRLIDKYEQQLPQPVTLEEIPEKTVNDDIRGIIGFEITIDDLQAVFKLSQNRDEQSYHEVIGHLQEGDASSQAVAEAMDKKTSQLFKKEE